MQLDPSRREAAPTEPTERLRLAIDARPLGGVPCGYTIYIMSVIRCLVRAGFEITLLSNVPLRPEYEEIAGIRQRVFGSWRGLRWEQIDLPAELTRTRFDVYLSAANRGIPLKKSKGTRYVLVLYDVIPFVFLWQNVR